MNCAVHTDQPAAAYCRTCGKPLCDTCKRDVRGVIYCEDCIAARVQGVGPEIRDWAMQNSGLRSTPGPAPGTAPAGIPPATGPNPALATILAIFFPFGVPQVYFGQYAKGLVHLGIFAFLIFGMDQTKGGADAVFGIAFAFYYIYQIIDANRSAKAILAGQPAPDPFGLGKALGTENLTPQNVPIGAIILIGIGALFLLQNVGIFHFHWFGKLWPLILIALGLRIVMRNKTPR